MLPMAPSTSTLYSSPVDVMEMIQRYVLANSKLESEMRFASIIAGMLGNVLCLILHMLHLESAGDEERVRSREYSSLRSGNNWHKKKPLMTLPVACVQNNGVRSLRVEDTICRAVREFEIDMY